MDKLHDMVTRRDMMLFLHLKKKIDNKRKRQQRKKKKPPKGSSIPPPPPPSPVSSKVLDIYSKDEYDYFCRQPILVQNHFLTVENKIHTYQNYDDNIPIRFRVLQMKCNVSIKSKIIDKLTTISMMDRCSDEYCKSMAWVRTLCKVPFGLYKQLPLYNNVNKFLQNTRDILDKEVYGHVETKQHILMNLAKWIVNPDAPGIIIGICSGVGQGKSLLVKEGLSKALGIPCAFIPLGGANDSTILDGHSYTYTGSTHGKIVDALLNTRCMNPILCFDELDKVADNSKGNEIYNVLIHITDTTQNDMFHDNYFAGIDFDLSRAIIVFTYNDESKIHPVLKDRMIQINMKSYNTEDMLVIARDYMLPKLLDTYKFQIGDVIISNDVLKSIIVDHRVTGMRDVKRVLDATIGQFNLDRLIGAKTTPFNVTIEDMKKQLPMCPKEDVISHMYI